MAIAPRHKLNSPVRDLQIARAGRTISFARSHKVSVCLVALLLATGVTMLGGCSPINHLRDDYMGKSLLQPGKARPGNETTTDPALERARRYSEGVPPAATKAAEPQSTDTPAPNSSPAASDSRIGFPTLRRRPSGATPNSGSVPRDEYGNPILN